MTSNNNPIHFNPFGKNYNKNNINNNNNNNNRERNEYTEYSNEGFVNDVPNSGAKNASAGDRTKAGKEGDGLEARGTWGGKAEFVLSCLGYAVGLGNVWRFPYLVYQNGGGAFLIPYILMLILIGLPCFFMEMIVGQYSASGPMQLWSIAPLFTGIGFGMEIITFMSSISYNIVMSWAFYYLIASWNSVVPWQDCKNYFNSPNCYTLNEASTCESYNNGSTKNVTTARFWWFNQTCFDSTYCGTNDLLIGCNRSYVDASRVSASQEYFYKRVLNTSDGIEDSGKLQWELVLVLLLAWIVCWLCTLKGIKSAGKVVYFTALFPYVVLFIFLVRGATLDGSLKGVLYYIRPDWNRLADAKVWVDAAGQVFFSLSVGMGGLMTFASYNKFNNNIYRDTLLVVGLDAVTSILAGFAVFAIMGHMSFKLNVEVERVVKSGPGLAFIVYPEVMTYLPPPQLWATLFFLMLLTLGIDTQMANIETLMTAIVDFYPVLRRWKPLVSASICFIMFLLGLTMCLRSGLYWLELMTTYSSGFSLVLIAAFEIIVFSWVYGARKLMQDLETMTSIKLWWHWWALFKIVSPILILGILVFSFVDHKAITYSNNLPYPYWSQVLGNMMAWVSVVVVPIVAVFIVIDSYAQAEYDGLAFGWRLWALTKPSSKWLPGPEKARLEAELAGTS